MAVYFKYSSRGGVIKFVEDFDPDFILLVLWLQVLARESKTNNSGIDFGGW
jgi:hypothetical protein